MSIHENFRREGSNVDGCDGGRILGDGGSRNVKSEIPEIARALAECRGIVDADGLERAILAGCIYADAIVLSDDIIDYAASGIHWVREVPRTGAYFLDAAIMWSELFGPSHFFWTALRRYHREYLETMQLEGEINAGIRTWESCDERLCLAIVRGKNGPVRAIAAFIAGLAGDSSALADLESLTLGYFAVNQMLDDVRDWRDDIRDGNISLVLRRASPQRPLLDNVQSVGARMFGEGHVDYVLQSACRELTDLVAFAHRLGAVRYAQLLYRRLDQFTRLAAQLRCDIRAARPRLSTGA